MHTSKLEKQRKIRFIPLVLLGMMALPGYAAADTAGFNPAAVTGVDQLVLNITRQDRDTHPTVDPTATYRLQNGLDDYASVSRSNLLNSPAARYLAKQVFVGR